MLWKRHGGCASIPIFYKSRYTVSLTPDFCLLNETAWAHRVVIKNNETDVSALKTYQQNLNHKILD